MPAPKVHHLGHTMQFESAAGQRHLISSSAHKVFKLQCSDIFPKIIAVNTSGLTLWGCWLFKPFGHRISFLNVAALQLHLLFASDC
jgi:hypothetical protein